MEIACGQCLGCRLDRSRMWAMRIVHESTLHEMDLGSCFITLTYRDRIDCTDEQLAAGQHVPDDFGLRKSHFTKFMKRLRKHFAPHKLRFFQTGEYGRICLHGLDLELVKCPMYCQRGRPHHHAILFNCHFPDLEIYENREGQDRYTSKLLERIWGYGFVDVGTVTFESAAYVARYALKKITGVKAESVYERVTLDGEVVTITPEYCTMSRRPGLGKNFYTLYKGDMFPSDEVPVPGLGVLPKVPRYYEELFKIEDPLSLEEIKEVRRQFRDKHAEDYTPERLMDKYKVKKAQHALLKRNLA